MSLKYCVVVIFMHVANTLKYSEDLISMDQYLSFFVTLLLAGLLLIATNLVSLWQLFFAEFFNEESNELYFQQYVRKLDSNPLPRLQHKVAISTLQLLLFCAINASNCDTLPSSITFFIVINLTQTLNQLYFKYLTLHSKKDFVFIVVFVIIKLLLDFCYIFLDQLASLTALLNIHTLFTLLLEVSLEFLLLVWAQYIFHSQIDLILDK